MEMLCHCEWPGNIRELANVVERAMILCESDTLTPTDLSPAISGLVPGAAADWERPGIPGIDPETWFDRPWQQVRHGVLAACERAYLAHQLHVCRGSLAQVAERTDIPPRTLYAMMKKHGLKKETFRMRRTTSH